MLQVELRIPDAFQAQARYAFRILATRWQIPLRFTTDARTAQVCYTPDPSSYEGPGVPLPFDPTLYDPRTRCLAVEGPEGLWSWRSAALDESQQPDLVGGVYRLLDYLDETQVDVDARDRRGVFPSEALPEARRRVSDLPLVEHHAQILLGRLLESFPELKLASVPRWPRGKRYALCLTHDVDAVHLGSVTELSTNFAKTVLRRDPNHFRLFLTGFRYLGRKSANPYFAFPVWREWESLRDLRSAFFVYYRPPHARPDLNDCKTGLAGRGTDWGLLRSMAEEGWEFGLHPSIHTKTTEHGFSASRNWLERMLGCSVEGLRHHYWALDWMNPASTQRLHQQAGFRYDSSIAWRDQAGFRAGTALPFNPFDRSGRNELDLIEVPCVLMDNHVLKRRSSDAVDRAGVLQRGKDVIDRVIACGGVLTVNWHQETGMNRFHYQSYLQVLDDVLLPLLASSDVWVATPRQVSERWREFSRMLFADVKDERIPALA